MSWKDRLENIQFTIITGDGKIYKPLWKNGIKTKKYNFSNYNFIDVEGGFIDRKKPQASKFPLVFWFQGDDNIDLADAFEESADNPKAWQIKHPFYGNIIGQPTSLNRNDLNYNTTEITIEFWESINEDYPSPKTSINDIIISKTNDVSEAAQIEYNSNVNPESEDIQILNENLTQVSSVFDKLFDNDTYSDYQTLISKAEKDVNNLISSPLEAIISLNTLLLTPSLFEKSVKDKINSLEEAFGKLKDTLLEYNDVNTKLYFEAQTAVNIAAICQSVATPLPTDYITRTEIEEINTKIVNIYNEYLELLDNAQVEISDVDDTYYPDSVVQAKLYSLITETTGQLFALAFQAKQERIIEVEKDTNLVVLTHKYLGLDSNDENIQLFRELNEIKNNELFLIKKGRIIKYFV